MQENNCLKLPRMSDHHWCKKIKLATFNIDLNFDYQMSLRNSKCRYSNNCLHFLKCAVPLKVCHINFPMGKMGKFPFPAAFSGQGISIRILMFG